MKPKGKSGEEIERREGIRSGERIRKEGNRQ